jgi:hypothetical protein
LGQLLEVETNATECGLKGKNVVRRRGKVVGRQGEIDGCGNLFGLIKLNQIWKKMKRPYQVD